MITKTKNAARQPGRGGPMFLNEGWSHSRERRHYALMRAPTERARSRKKASLKGRS
jgi:hypothetical protein